MAGTDSPPAKSPALATGNSLTISRQSDCALTTAALLVCVLATGHAVDLADGTYTDEAMGWLTIAAGFCVLAIFSIRSLQLETLLLKFLPAMLAVGIALETMFLIRRVGSDPYIELAFITVAVLSALQIANLRSMRMPLILIAVLAFCVAGALAFEIHSKYPGIDVFIFQSGGAHALLHGMNPYQPIYPNVYEPTTPFYGPGVVDTLHPLPAGFIQFWHEALPQIVYPNGLYPVEWRVRTVIGSSGLLTVGFPYPPFSLLLTLPGYLLGGDVRYSHVVALGLSAVLMVAARPGRIAPLAAALLLLMPRATYVLDLGWTEPLLIFTFSLVMYSALRWPRALPYALGLYFSTKQYSVLSLPLLPLLIEGPNHWRTLGRVVIKAGIVVAAINLPFFLADPHAFLRSVVVFQFLQPFRDDALSYLVLIHRLYPDFHPPMWLALLPLVIVIPLSLRRLSSSPAGFCAAVTAVHFFFFAFNKQAFCNYYYFVIATACWAIAAANFPALAIRAAAQRTAGAASASAGSR
jgi:hypothetical protein